jgi:2,4-dienoyl-CoA reductase-like NADH-dependent reductase (Old Yellow Enzyme family)
VLQPYQLGALQLPNRVVMSPMTRGRATNPLLIPTELDVEYFTQRGSAGLIVTVGTWVNQDGIGYPTCPDCAPTTRLKRGRRPPRSTSAAAAFSPNSVTSGH